jgi:hypothetical protein
MDPVLLAMLQLSAGGLGIFVMWLWQERRWAAEAREMERAPDAAE